MIMGKKGEKMINEEPKVNIKIVMSKTFFDKIDWFVHNYEQEIGGWIEGKVNEEGFYLKDLLIPNQDVSSGSVETEPKDLVKLRKEYGNRCQDIVGNWHSHNTMGAFWSHIDEEFVEKYMQGRDMRIFIVSSTNGHLLRVEIRKPFFISVDKLNFEIEHKNNKFAKELQKEINKKCTESKTKIFYNGYDYDKHTYRDPLKKDDYEKEKEIEIKVSQMIKINKENRTITITEIYADFAQELQQLFKQYNPIRTPLRAGMEVKETIIFSCSSKKETKRLFSELFEYLTAAIESEEYQSYDHFFNGGEIHDYS